MRQDPSIRFYTKSYNKRWKNLSKTRTENSEIKGSTPHTKILQYESGTHKSRDSNFKPQYNRFPPNPKLIHWTISFTIRRQRNPICHSLNSSISSFYLGFQL